MAGKVEFVLGDHVVGASEAYYTATYVARYMYKVYRNARCMHAQYNI